MIPFIFAFRCHFSHTLWYRIWKIYTTPFNLQTTTSVFLFDIYLFMALSVNMKWTLHTLHYYVWAISSFRCTFKYDCFRLKIIANMFVHHSNIYYGIEDLIKWKIAKFTIVLNWLQRQLGWKVFIIVVCWLWKALKLFIQRKKIFHINFSF